MRSFLQHLRATVSKTPRDPQQSGFYRTAGRSRQSKAAIDRKVGSSICSLTAFLLHPTVLTIAMSTLVGLTVQSAPAAACTKTAPDGAYATTGIRKNSIWWLNFECYDDTTAATTAGQPFSFALPDGSTMTLTVTKTGSGTAGSGVQTVTPPSWSGSAFGNGVYNNIPGKPVFYNTNYNGSTGFYWQETLTGITVKDTSGNTRNYGLVVADGESTGSNGPGIDEQLTFKTSGSWQLLELIYQPNSNVAPTPILAGTGTNTATWTGTTNNGSNWGSVILSTDLPTTVSVKSATLGTFANGGGGEGALFGISMPKITLIDNLNNGRVAAADQFTTQIAYDSPIVSLKTDTSTGTATTSSTGETSVLHNNVVRLSATMAAGSTSALSAYRSSIDCTNANSTPTVLPSGLGTSFTLTPQLGDDITCTLTNTALKSIAGTVFEDKNYGGQAGRSLAGSGGIGRGGATVELYDSTGTLQQTTTTSTVAGTLGRYSFSNLIPGNYTVRVVNSTVTSARTGSTAGLLPVQTFRTNGGTADPNRVGGENPQLSDAPVNTGTQTLADLTTSTTTAESIAPVTVGSSNISAIDFGFNFDTIVNTNDLGQGSLRQFIINSNALKGEASLAQANGLVPLTAGFETSIFMIPATRLTGGVAVINLASTLPAMTDPNTRIDGSTQTTNIGDTNSGQIGTGGTVGVDRIALARFDKPEVEIKGSYILTASGTGESIANIAFNQGCISVTGSNSSAINNFIGMDANGTSTPTPVAYGINIGSGSNINIKHNYVRVNDSGIRRDGNGSNLIVESNEVDVPSSVHTKTFDGILLIGSGNSDTIKNNLVHNMGGAGTELYTGALVGTLLENNTYDRNGYYGLLASPETMGIVVYNAGTSNSITLSKNIITNNAGAGVVVMGSSGVKLTQNSFSGNGLVKTGSGGLAIDLNPTSGDPNSYDLNTTPGVTPNGTTGTIPNQGMNYPIFKRVTLNGTTLRLKGYIGTAAQTTPSAAFGNATIEIFKANNDGNNNGKIIATDSLNVPHGEGETYLGSITADANGNFDSSITVSGITSTTLLTATATNTAGNTSEFSNATITNADVQLVKRITAINGQTTNPNDNTDLSTAATVSPFPSTYPLVGAIDGGKVISGDEIEYSIYFINSGGNRATDFRICDKLNANLTFQTQFAPTTTATQGIVFKSEPSGNIETLTNNTSDDRGYFISPNTPTTTATLPTNCNLTNLSANPSGVVVVDVVTGASNYLPGSGLAGSYGYVKFKAKVK
jgi:parallel beta-helix repeat protein